VVEPAPASVSAPWVAVAGWAAENQLSAPQRVTLTTNPVFEIRSDQGVLAFQTGTQRARFNGMTLWLGFEPILSDGEPCLHERDVARNVAPLLLQAPGWEAGRRVVVIDPGHGGGNTGTRSADGQLEKDYTLDWALRLRPLLESNGWTVRLTRTNDAELTLPERVAFADAAGADLFISLHFNASGGGNHQSGLETYCLTPTGMPSNLTRDYDDDLTLAYPNNAFDTENLLLAVALHRALLQVNGGEDRGLRRARFMGVLRGQNRPAVLVEGGYLSNPAEAARIHDPEYRQKLAEAVASGLGKVNP
jgi:N-acetylmuramoyl-L-alanine amidase